MWQWLCALHPAFNMSDDVCCINQHMRAWPCQAFPSVSSHPFAWCARLPAIFSSQSLPVRGVRYKVPPIVQAAAQLVDDATLLRRLSCSHSKVLFALSLAVFCRRNFRRPSPLLNKFTGYIFEYGSPNRSVATLTRALGYLGWACYLRPQSSAGLFPF